jgi:ATP-binding cassette subfamily F protein 3
MLRISDLTYHIGGRTLFDGASVSVPAGARAGLVGRNGCGKTTLLRLVVGELHADGGIIETPRRWRIATLPQEAPGGSERVIDHVLSADEERTALLAEVDGGASGERAAEAHRRLAEIGAHAAPARAAEILAGLGFDHDDQQQPCSALAGGWRMRAALAAILFADPDLLLLDEPTNHLDIEATAWLESFLARFTGTLLLVSHDRDLLDKIADRTIHIENGKITAYAGNYTTFERTLDENRRLRRRANAAIAAERERMLAFVARFGAKATKARQAQSRLNAIAKLPAIEPVIETRPIEFQFPEPEPVAPPLIAASGAAVGYGGAPVLSRLDFTLDADDRIAILGANGNGKSTLLRLLAGRLEPQRGSVRRSPKLRVGYFAQHQLEELSSESTAYQHLARLAPMELEPKLRAHLGRFGLAQELADVPAGQLSGGERTRLVLALICRTTPNILILDEPTNHLDIESRRALVQALNAFAGAVVLVTHDSYLIRLVADILWVVDGGTCRPFEGDVDEYRTAIIEARRDRRRDAATNGGRRMPSRRELRREAAEARLALAPLRRRASEADAELARCAAEKAEIEERLANPSIYDGPPETLRELLKSRGDIEKRLAAAEADWLAAHEALAEASGE